MKKITGLLVLITFLCLLISCSNNDFTSTFSYQPANAQPGNKIELLFNADSTKLADAENITAVVYQYNIDLESTTELKMQKLTGGWKTSFKTDNGTKGIVVKFVSGDEEENNDNKGYIITLNDEAGKELAEAEPGLAVAYATWGPNAGLYRDREKANKMLKDFFDKHPDKKINYLDTYFYTVEKTMPDELTGVLTTELAALEQKAVKNSIELRLLEKYYLKLGEKEKSEKYGEELRNSFDGSEQAQESFIALISGEKNSEKQLDMLAQFEKDYPESEHLADAYEEVAFSLLDSKKIDQLAALIKGHPNKPPLYIYYYAVNAFVDADYNEDETYEIAKLGSERNIEDIQTAASRKPKSYTEQDWLNEVKYYAGINSFVYGKVLMSRGQPQIALSHLKDAVDNTLEFNSRPDINIEYINCLIEVKEPAKAMKTIEEFISKGKSDSEMKEVLKKLYVDKNGSEEGFDEYTTEFEKIAYGELIDKVKSELISKEESKPAPGFELYDTEGKLVKLSDFKNKIVIVDFWATWCGPCRKSFPGMKMAVEKYQDNDNVKFLFVNTWERVDDKLENAKKFMRDNRYPFHVLMDTENKVVGAYKVQGIPTKFILDKDHDIRFVSIGMSGSPEHLADELGVMISTLDK
jgi:thiol-disulfide isomerase/thioredoxin